MKDWIVFVYIDENQLCARFDVQAKNSQEAVVIAMMRTSDGRVSKIEVQGPLN